jgi:hypothetical protein
MRGTGMRRKPHDGIGLANIILAPAKARAGGEHMKHWWAERLDQSKPCVAPGARAILALGGVIASIVRGDWEWWARHDVERDQDPTR